MTVFLATLAGVVAYLMVLWLVLRVLEQNRHEDDD